MICIRLIFSVCFYTGLIFTVLSFIIGQVFNLFDFGFGDSELDFDLDTDVDVDFDTDVDVDTDMDFSGKSFLLSIFSLLKPVLVFSFITTFGGVGLIGVYKGVNVYLITPVAVVLGLGVASAIQTFILKPLHRVETEGYVESKQSIGSIGEVISTISGKGFGSIKYVIKGSTFNSPAKSTTGRTIKQGEKVVIEKIEGNVFFVRKSSNLDA